LVLVGVVFLEIPTSKKFFEKNLKNSLLKKVEDFWKFQKILKNFSFFKV